MLEPFVYSELIKGLWLAVYSTCECEIKGDKGTVLAFAVKTNENAGCLIQTATTCSQIQLVTVSLKMPISLNECV